MGSVRDLWCQQLADPDNLPSQVVLGAFKPISFTGMDVAKA